MHLWNTNDIKLIISLLLWVQLRQSPRKIRRSVYRQHDCHDVLYRSLAFSSDCIWFTVGLSFYNFIFSFTNLKLLVFAINVKTDCLIFSASFETCMWSIYIFVYGVNFLLQSRLFLRVCDTLTKLSSIEMRFKIEINIETSVLDWAKGLKQCGAYSDLKLAWSHSEISLCSDERVTANRSHVDDRCITSSNEPCLVARYSAVTGAQHKKF